MIVIKEFKIDLDYKEEDFRNKIFAKLNPRDRKIYGRDFYYIIKKQSIDARKRDKVHYSFQLEIYHKNEKEIYEKALVPKGLVVASQDYLEHNVEHDTIKKETRPVVLGLGPAVFLQLFILLWLVISRL